jgi:hypothetical protein
MRIRAGTGEMAQSNLFSLAPTARSDVFKSGLQKTQVKTECLLVCRPLSKNE